MVWRQNLHNWVVQWENATTDTWDVGEPFNLQLHQNYLEWYRSRTRIYLRKPLSVESLPPADTTQLYPSSITSSHHLAVSLTNYFNF